MSQMSVVIDSVEWFLARKDFERCHFSWENFPYASPKGFSGQLSDMLYAEITWIQRAFALHLLWQHTCGVSGHHGFGPWSQLLLEEQSLPPLLSPVTHRTPVVFILWKVVWAWHTVKLGCGKICGRGNAILHSSTEWCSGHQGLSAPEPVGCLVTERQHSGQGVGVMGVKIFVQLNGNFFSLIITD